MTAFFTNTRLGEVRKADGRGCESPCAIDRFILYPAGSMIVICYPNACRLNMLRQIDWPFLVLLRKLPEFV